METVSQLTLDEAAGLDHDQLSTLYAQLGPMAAEDVLRRAMEELALRMSHANRLFRQEDYASLRKNARSLSAIAEQVGMIKLAHIARDVVATVDQADEVAVAATLSRLMRVGERSLTKMWELQDLTI